MSSPEMPWPPTSTTGGVVEMHLPHPGPEPTPGAPSPSPANLQLLRRLALAAHHLAVLATARPNGSIQATVVTAGVMTDPLAGQPAVACVAGGGTVKLTNLRRDPRATIVFRAGGEWVTIEGRVSL